ncbi:MAG TPA: hypothetical protein VG323_09125 [Thermoanaerobaculia bacterium]|nr:hypothetical protein [Thermoanaerobaculia bacterium]
MSEINVDKPPDSQPLTPEELVETLRALRQRIPDYVQLPIPDAKSVRAVASLDPQFKQSAINAVGASDLVKEAVGLTAEELRQMSEDADRWSAAADELRAMLQGVLASILTRRHRVGLASLQTYNITRQLVRHEDHSDLLPHLHEMKRLNRFGRRRRKVAPEPAPGPQPTT